MKNTAVGWEVGMWLYRPFPRVCGPHSLLYVQGWQRPEGDTVCRDISVSYDAFAATDAVGTIVAIRRRGCDTAHSACVTQCVPHCATVSVGWSIERRGGRTGEATTGNVMERGRLDSNDSSAADKDQAARWLL